MRTVLLLAVAVLLAGCTEPAPAPAPSLSVSDGAAPVSSPPAPSAGSPGGSAPPAASPSAPDREDGDAGAGPERAGVCLEGTWVLTAPALRRTVEDVLLRREGAPRGRVEVSGETVLDFGRSTVRQEFTERSVRLALELGPGETEVTLRVRGTSVAEYEVTGDTIRVRSVDSSRLRSSVRAVVDGRPVDSLPVPSLEELLERTGDTLPEGRSRFRCEGETLVLLTEVEGVGTVEHVLERRP